MPIIHDFMFSHAEIAFFNEVEPTQETTNKSGNATTINAAQPGDPAHYLTTFRINFELESGGRRVGNYLGITVSVPNGSVRAAYREVEIEAAQQLAPALRAVADQIEAEVEAVDGKPEPAD